MMNERTCDNDTPTTPIDAACSWDEDFDIVVIGGGTAGIGITASLLRRQSSLRIAIVEPSDWHYYQPAWTLVGGSTYDTSKTVHPTASVIPSGATWSKIILAKLGYGGKLLPTFHLDPTVPRHLAWLLKVKFLPWFYWHGFLKGREWLAHPGSSTCVSCSRL
jgi:hypothetical protein